MPHIVVKMYKGRNEEQKSELAKALVETAVKVTGRGAEHFSVAVEDYDPEIWTEEVYDKEIVGGFVENYKALADDLNICSKRGLSERFDSTIGAGGVLMPFGGKHQLTPVQAMVQKVSVEKQETDDCREDADGKANLQCVRNGGAEGIHSEDPLENVHGEASFLAIDTVHQQNCQGIQNKQGQKSDQHHNGGDHDGVSQKLLPLQSCALAGSHGRIPPFSLKVGDGGECLHPPALCRTILEIIPSGNGRQQPHPER